MTKYSVQEIADNLASEVLTSRKSKRIKVRTLLGYFDYKQRTEENATRITELLFERNILLNPSIMKLGDTWKLKLDDKVRLSERPVVIPEGETLSDKIDINLDSDKWFTEILNKQFRTEKEVENKFILPLLKLLGYNNDDRWDGMIVHAAHGSRPTTLEVDFALFNDENKNLSNQTLLVVEAKMEYKLCKQIELIKTQRQVKSYAVWLSCYFGLVTDSKTIQVIDLFPSIQGMKVIFECSRETLKDNFKELYSLVSKARLTNYYELLIR